MSEVRKHIVFYGRVQEWDSGIQPNILPVPWN